VRVSHLGAMIYQPCNPAPALRLGLY
jgi:hypothetical protein